MLEYYLRAVDGVSDVKVYDRTRDAVILYTSGRGGVIAAEWCENIPFALPDKRYEVIFEKTGGDARKIHIRTVE